jgi:hypothetical protein
MFLTTAKHSRRMIMEDNTKYVKKYNQFQLHDFTSHLTSLQKAVAVASKKLWDEEKCPILYNIYVYEN